MCYISLFFLLTTYFLTVAGDSSEPVFHAFYAVLQSSDAHSLEVCAARQTNSFLLAPSDWRRLLPW